MGSRKRRRGRDAEYSEKTHLIHGRFHSERWDFRHHVVPPQSASVTYRLDSSQRGAQGFVDFAAGHADHRVPIYIYDRLDEPTRGMLEQSLAFAEDGEVCVAFATGMAAIAAALGILAQVGQGVVCHSVVYGCTYSLLRNWMPRQGIEVQFLDVNDTAALRRSLKPHVRVVYFETPTNPDLEIIDIAQVRRCVDEVNAGRPETERVHVVVDNTFATPYCQRPLALGADVVVHSLTKNIGGFGTDMGGAVIGPRGLESMLMQYRKDFGGVLSTRSAWPILVYGLPTLAVRVRQQQHTALRVARYLDLHPRVASVRYPGLESFPQRELAERQMRDYEGRYAPGTMIHFTMATQCNLCVEAFVDAIARDAYCVTLAVSLGNVKTLLEHPASMTHSSIAADGGNPHVNAAGVRLSIGLEKGDDIIHDLSVAFGAACVKHTPQPDVGEEPADLALSTERNKLQ